MKKGTKKLMVTYKQLREEMIALKKRVRDRRHPLLVRAVSNSIAGVYVLVMFFAVAKHREALRIGKGVWRHKSLRVAFHVFLFSSSPWFSFRSCEPQRANSAQAKEDGIMATAFYTLGLVGLSDDSIDTHRGWLTAARQRQRAARSPR